MQKKGPFDPNKYVSKGIKLETVEELKRVFDVFDADGSGTISTEEMLTTIQALGMEEKMVDVMAKFDKVDVEKLDFDAFLGAFGFNEGYQYRNITKGQTNAHLVECRDMFQQFDSNGNGGISVKEFKDMAAFAGMSFTDKEIDDIIQCADIMDHDGKIGYQEFERIYSGAYLYKK